MNQRLIRASKFLSHVLRHRPEAIGVTLDEGGWVDVDELLEACRRAGKRLTQKELLEVVALNDKQRFTMREGRIRANQGHSIDVDLGLDPVEPPMYLYHGTAEHRLEAIRQNGLRRMNRHHVHLSPDVDTARRVGIRHGTPVILQVSAGAMFVAGYAFYLSENGVWLTECVPCQYLEEVNPAL